MWRTILSSWNAYPNVFSLGHKAIKDLLSVDVIVEEKCDGSQFSFGLVEASSVDIEAEDKSGYALKIRSRGCVMHIDAPEKMFTKAAETVKSIAHLLTLGWTYRGEFLCKPFHNALNYDRVPKGNIIIFDVNSGNQEYLKYADKKVEAERLGLECVPLLFSGRIGDVSTFRQFLSTTSILGGQCIEGVVVKPVNYDLYGTDKKVLMGKFVSESYKEVHRKAWGEANPAGKDIIAKLVEELKQPARWNKSIQHLREAGKLLDDVRDIGPLIKEIPEDIKKEEEDYIKEKLFGWAWQHIRRGVTAGFPMYYKELLLKRSFENNDEYIPTEQSGDGGVQDVKSGHVGVADSPAIVDNEG